MLKIFFEANKPFCELLSGQSHRKSHDNKNKLVPYHKPRWPNYYSSFVRNNNVIPRALPMPGLNLSRKMNITIQIEREHMINPPLPYTPHHSSRALTKPNLSHFQYKYMSLSIFFLAKFESLLIASPHASFCCVTLSLSSSLSALSLLVYFPVQYKCALQGSHTQSCPLSPHRTLKFMCQISSSHFLKNIYLCNYNYQHPINNTIWLFEVPPRT